MPKQYLYVAKGGRETRMPIDAVTRTFAFLGQRGTGKTNAAVVLAEEMALAGGNVALFDPVGAHWGITRRGERAGIPGIVIGGEHGDVPLEETGGQLVAELIVARHWPVVVVDMKLMRKGAQLRFMADCLEGLFQMNREPLHAVFEEADRIMPQQLRSGDIFASRALGAGEDIVKLGRSRGLGASLVTQRPATIAKNVLEQVENLFLFRLIGPRDRKAARDWIEANADPAREKDVLDSLAKLKLGQAWLWSPAWLGLLRKIDVRHRRTFDSSFTPEVGAKVEEAGERAPVDLDQVREQMADTIERAKENDPKALKNELRKVREELETARKAHAGTIAAKPERMPYVPEEVRTDATQLAARALRAVERLDRACQGLAEAVDAAGDVRDAAAAHVEKVEAVAREEGAEEASATRPAAGYETSRSEGAVAPALPRPASPPTDNGEVQLDGAQRKLLSVLLQYPGGRTKRQLAIIAGYSQRGGGFNNALGRLRSIGLITAAKVEPIQATTAAAAALPEVDPLPRGHELYSQWLPKLSKAERAILEVLYEAHPEALPKEEIARAAGYEPTGGGFNNAMGKLRTLDLVEGYGESRASDALFD